MLLFLLVLVMFQFKHFFCDYLLQTDWMLGKFKPGVGWILPLAAHCAVHATATFLLAMFVYTAMLVFAFQLPWYSALELIVSAKMAFCFMLANFDFSVHFVMDRIKASPWLMGRWKALSASEYQAAKLSMVPKSCEVLLTKTDDPDTYNVYKTARKRLLENRLFWLSLGFDQLVHHLTHYVIVAWMFLQ